MHLSEIKKGGKYYHTIATNTLNRATQLKAKTTRIVRVVDVDPVKLKVCASVNGAPAKWYDQYTFQRWKIENPEEKEHGTDKSK